MPEPTGGRATQDFGLQSTDQSNRFGAVEGAPQHAYPAQPHSRYESTAATNATVVPPTRNRGPVLDSSVNYQDFNAQQPTLAHQRAPAQFPTYNFGPEGPMAWDWASAIDFSDFSSHYEPQGELVQELQNQSTSTNDFSIPQPISNPESAAQSLAQIPGAQPAAAQNPLSPPPRPPQRPSVQTGMKRKIDSEPNSAISQTAVEDKPTKRQAKSRTSSVTSAPSPIAATSTAPDTRPSLTVSMTAPAALENPPTTTSEVQKRKEPSKGTGPQGRVIDVSKPRRIVESPSAADILPSGKVFPIQIGSELFRLSGASIASDAPSYFSHFFGEQVHANQGRAGDIRTLYIDRDPETFRDIALHLQGYHISPQNGEHFVRLFADAQFYSLPRLTKQLFSTDIFVRIGGVPFQIPRDLFSSPGDSPNYFSLGFAQFFSTPSHVFPGLDRNALLRPPSISPPSVPNRCGETFGELVKMLQGYPLDIRNEAHRSRLLRDARYFHLKGLEQKLIPCEISYNLRRGQSEILIRLEDIRQSGVSFTPDSSTSNPNSGSGSNAPSVTGLSPAPSSPGPSLGGPQFKPGTVSYARPYTDDHANTNILILELSSNESTTLHLPIDAPKPSSPSDPPTLNMRATFHGTTLARITSLFSVIASKMGLPATQPLGLMMMQSGGGVAAQPVSPANSGVSERRVRVRLSQECSMDIDGEPAGLAVDADTGRLGIRRVGVEKQHKRIKVSESRSEYEALAEPGDGEWIWGGARESGVVISKDGEELGEELTVQRAHWRLRVESVEGESAKMQVVLCGVKIEGFSCEKSRNQKRGFLG